jgi:NADPH-dependent 2,4-dienoyl-CoA reductase/sulfur reductase-like enzyme
LILGGGPSGVEIAQALGRMGVAVTIVESAERLLPREAAGVGEALAEALRAEGIELRLGSPASAAEREGDHYVLRFDDGAELRGERLLVATGRRPRLDGLGLENVRIRLVGGAVPVDEHLRAADGIWAIGDATAIMPFTHVGKYQARIAARDMFGEAARADYRAVPRVVFTDPQVAAVGEQEGVATGTVELSGVAHLDLHPRVRRAPRLPHPGHRRREADRRLRPGSGGGRVASAGDARDPRRGPARDPAGHDPAVSDVLGGVRQRARRPRRPARRGSRRRARG